MKKVLMMMWLLLCVVSCIDDTELASAGCERGLPRESSTGTGESVSGVGSSAGSDPWGACSNVCTCKGECVAWGMMHPDSYYSVSASIMGGTEQQCRDDLLEKCKAEAPSWHKWNSQYDRLVVGRFNGCE